SGSARMNGCTAPGKRSAEKKIPERIHIGNITRFISPETASMVFARHAVSSPRELKHSEAIMHRIASCHKEPRSGTPKTSTAKARNATTSNGSISNRESTKDARYCQRRIGDATN